MTSHNTKKQNPVPAPKEEKKETPAVKKLFHGTAPLEIVIDAKLGDKGKQAVYEKFGYLEGKNGASRLYMNERYKSATAYQDFLARFFTTLIYTSLVPRADDLVFDWQTDVVTLSQVEDSRGNSAWSRTFTTVNLARPELAARHKDEMCFLRSHKKTTDLSDLRDMCAFCGQTEHPANLLKLEEVPWGHYTALTSIFSYGMFDFTKYLNRLKNDKRSVGYVVTNDFSAAAKRGIRVGAMMDGERHFSINRDRVTLEGEGVLGRPTYEYLDIVGKQWMIQNKQVERGHDISDWWLCEVLDSTIPNGDVDAKIIKVSSIVNAIPGLEVRTLVNKNFCLDDPVRNLEKHPHEIKGQGEEHRWQDMLSDLCAKQGEALKVQGENIVLKIFNRPLFGARTVKRTYTAPSKLVAEAMMACYGKTSSGDVLRAQKAFVSKQKTGADAGSTTKLMSDTLVKSDAFTIALHLSAISFGSVQSYLNTSETVAKAKETLTGVSHDFRQQLSWANVGKLLTGLLLVLALVPMVLYALTVKTAPTTQRVLIQDDGPASLNTSLILLLVMVIYFGVVLVVLFFRNLLRWCRRRDALESNARSLTSSCVTIPERLDLEAGAGRYDAN
jgi:hypothetical protein